MNEIIKILIYAFLIFGAGLVVYTAGYYDGNFNGLETICGEDNVSYDVYNEKYNCGVELNGVKTQFQYIELE